MRVSRYVGSTGMRAAAVVALSVALPVVCSARAQAHGATNTPASNYVSRVLAVTPAAEGFSVKVVEAGNRLEVRWRSGPEIVINDYDDHPYLRIGRTGAFENRQSNAVYLNADRRGATTIPPGLRPEGSPEWRKLSSSPVVRFHDHRVHWMGTSPPPQVQAERCRKHLIQTWAVPISRGTASFIVSGDLRWVPGPSPIPPLAAAGALGLLLVGAVVMSARRGRSRLALVLFSLMLGTLVFVDAIHLLGIAFGVKGGSGFGRVVSIGWVSLVAWVVALLTIVALRGQRMDALYVGVFAAGIVTLVGGLSDIGVLSSSSLPFAFSNGVARASIAITLGLGIATVIAGVMLTGNLGRPNQRAAEPVDPGTLDVTPS